MQRVRVTKSMILRDTGSDIRRRKRDDMSHEILRRWKSVSGQGIGGADPIDGRENEMSHVYRGGDRLNLCRCGFVLRKGGGKKHEGR